MKIIHSPSPNYDSRGGERPEVMIIHCTDGSFPHDLAWLRDRQSVVSSHFYIAPNGDIHQLVDVHNRAWHAGRVDHPTAPIKKDVNPNAYSIGIEVSLKGDQSIQGDQYKSLRDLVKYLSKTYVIPIDRAHIWGHKEVFSLKSCPGAINVDGLVKGLTPAESREAIKQQIYKLLERL